MRVTALCVVVGLAPLLTGCLIMGRREQQSPLSAESVQALEPGMPKARVVELLGAPTEFIFSNKEHDPLREHAYIYEHVMTKYTGISFALINFGNADEKKDRVVVFFDDEGRVESVGDTLDADTTSYGFPFGK